MHFKAAIRFIYIAMIPFLSSAILTHGVLYYAYEKPVKRQERKRLEQEIVKAELSGFQIRPPNVRKLWIFIVVDVFLRIFEILE